MAERLAECEGRRMKFTAKFVRWGVRTGYQGAPLTTALFCEVHDQAKECMLEQVWFAVGRQIQALRLQRGDRVSFTARVVRYRKDSQPERGVEYCLKRPTQMHKANSDRVLPLFAGV